MPVNKQDKLLVACPGCGHQQPEPRGAYSSVCKQCGRHFRLQEVLNPVREPPKSAPELKRVICFECGAELEVPAAAESTMCKRCSRYVDLKDYHIVNAVSKNFKTKGAFVIEPKGYVFNTEAIVGDAVIKGRFLGKLVAERSLTVYSTAEIKGSFTARHLIVPVANYFRWQEPLRVGSAEVAGELVGNLHAAHTVTLKSTARFFGNLEAANLAVEAGAVVVGQMRVAVKESHAK
jgi:cytoskeletal protein CcmA (bactofilin family)/DNA-directed RNA polymerase subunit RPC12/RpoP